MRIPPVSTTYHPSHEDNEERRRQRLLALIRELAATDPDIARLNREIVSSGIVDQVICKKVYLRLEGKSDRRSLRTKRLLMSLMEL